MAADSLRIIDAFERALTQAIHDFLVVTPRVSCATHLVFGVKQRELWEAMIGRAEMVGRMVRDPKITGHKGCEYMGCTVIFTSVPDLLVAGSEYES